MLKSAIVICCLITTVICSDWTKARLWPDENAQHECRSCKAIPIDKEANCPKEGYFCEEEQPIRAFVLTTDSCNCQSIACANSDWQLAVNGSIVVRIRCDAREWLTSFGDNVPSAVCIKAKPDTIHSTTVSTSTSTGTTSTSTETTSTTTETTTTSTESTTTSTEPSTSTTAACKPCGATPLQIDENPANGATSFITKGPPCTEYTFVCGGSSIQLNSQVSVYDADDGVTDGKVTVSLTCNDASTWWQYQGSRNIYKIGCYGSSIEPTTSTTTESTTTSTETTTTSTESTTSTTTACATCAAASPTIDEDFANGAQPFLSKVKECNKWTFVCSGYGIEFNDGEQVSDSGDGTPDGKVTMELECSANGATWQFAGVDITFITCLGT